jgi:hypothetical protein
MIIDLLDDEDSKSRMERRVIFTRLHGTTSQETAVIIFIAVRTSNFAVSKEHAASVFRAEETLVPI